MPALILASGSPRRRELLERVGIAVEVRPPDIDESVHPGEQAVAYARRVASEKAAAVAQAAPGRWVLAADTVVEVGGAILGKAGDGAEAAAMLEQLSGQIHRVITAFCLRGPGGAVRERAVTTEVELRPLGRDEIEQYVAAGEWVGKAGAYAVQGMAAAMVSRVAGSITNVIGLPLAEVVDELAAAGAARVNYRAGTAD